MSYQDICYLSATEALERFRRHELSPVELMQAIINRAERMEPGINAFTATFYERALEQARKSEAKYMRKGARLRALEGLLRVLDALDPGLLLLREDFRRGRQVDCERGRREQAREQQSQHESRVRRPHAALLERTACASS